MNVAEPEKVAGLFDLKDSYQSLVGLTAEVLRLPEPEVCERLFREALQTGWNVTRAAREHNVVPHVYNAAMEEFYKRTNAFVFELLVIHQHPYCEEIDRRILRHVIQCSGQPENTTMLFLGDGIGSDSLRFASLGYNVAYFEFEGYSSTLALRRFSRLGVENRISVLHKLEDIPEGAFDILVCREVLEHVSDPPSVINNIWSYLKPQGVAFITESFHRVEKWFPTHLSGNQKYAGQTERLFVDAGFLRLSAAPDKRPMVFRKTSKSDVSRFNSLDETQGVFRRVGRSAMRRTRSLLRRF